MSGQGFFSFTLNPKKTQIFYSTLTIYYLSTVTGCTVISPERQRIGRSAQLTTKIWLSKDGDYFQLSSLKHFLRHNNHIIRLWKWKHVVHNWTIVQRIKKRKKIYCFYNCHCCIVLLLRLPNSVPIPSALSKETQERGLGLDCYVLRYYGDGIRNSHYYFLSWDK